MASDLQMPRPWQERGDDPLLAEIDAAGAEPAQAGGPVRIGALLAGLAERLGERDATCDKHGAYRSRGVAMGRARRVERWSPCPTCVAEEQRAEEQRADEAKAKARLEHLERLARSTAVPPLYVGKGFDDYVAETPRQQAALAKVRAFADRIDEHIEAGTTLVLAGGVGTGKTHLACAVLQAILPWRVGLYLSTRGLILMVRETWGRGAARSEREVLEELGGIDLLVIDEVGVQAGTESEQHLLFDVLDRRYMARRPTILMTNLDADGFNAYVGDRVRSRLREVGRWIAFDWGDYRGKVGA